MIKQKDQTFTMEELKDEVTALLDKYGLIDAQHDRRVSATVDVRTIRYYTTLGLLDRPRMEGREAFYGYRHVLQILAIKALQGTSMNLSEIQKRLYGRSDRELEAILAAVAAERSNRRKEEVHPVVWREWTIEPGLKILTEENWTSALEDRELEQRILTAIAAFRNKTRKEK